MAESSAMTYGQKAKEFQQNYRSTQHGVERPWSGPGSMIEDITANRNAHHQDQSPLFKLPFAIRARIYQHVIQTSPTTQPLHIYKNYTSQQYVLIPGKWSQTCYRMRLEAKISTLIFAPGSVQEVVYHVSNFDVDGLDQTIKSIKQMAKRFPNREGENRTILFTIDMEISSLDAKEQAAIMFFHYVGLPLQGKIEEELQIIRSYLVHSMRIECKGKKNTRDLVEMLEGLRGRVGGYEPEERLERIIRVLSGKAQIEEVVKAHKEEEKMNGLITVGGSAMVALGMGVSALAAMRELGYSD